MLTTKPRVDDEGSKEAESQISESELRPIMTSELEKFRTLVLTALPYKADRGDVINISSTPFFVDPPQEYSLPWHKDESVIKWGRHAMTSLALIAFLVLVVSPYFAGLFA
jgi:flagellar biosynthesis/type III secretory pathway M-ring protein FliF/YscJ